MEWTSAHRGGHAGQRVGAATGTEVGARGVSCRPSGSDPASPGSPLHFTPDIRCPSPQPTARLWAGGIWQESPDHLEGDESLAIHRARRTCGPRPGGRMSQRGEGRKATPLPRTRRLARPGHTESLWVLLEGLKAGPTDVGTWGAPCPPLQGTVQTARTGGHIWEGTRAERGHVPTQSKPVPAALPSPMQLARLTLAIVLGRPFRPTTRDQNQEDKQSKDLSEFPCPTHSPESTVQALSGPLHGN